VEDFLDLMITFGGELGSSAPQKEGKEWKALTSQRPKKDFQPPQQGEGRNFDDKEIGAEKLDSTTMSWGIHLSAWSCEKKRSAKRL